MDDALEKSTSKSAILDPHHTHFLLVDDGKQGVYGGEIEFRAAFEQCNNNAPDSTSAASQLSGWCSRLWL